MGKKDKKKAARGGKPNEKQMVNPEETQDLQSGESQSEEMRSEEFQSEELQSEELQSEELQSEELQSEELQSEEFQSEEAQTEETQQTGSMDDPGEEEGNETQSEDGKKGKLLRFRQGKEKASKPEKTPKIKREWKKPNIKIKIPLEKLKDRRVVTLGVFAAVALLMILLGILVLKIPVVPACALIVIETVLAVLLHNTELWTHGMLLLAEIITGILAGQLVFVLFCVVVYVAATISIQILTIEEKAVRRKS